VHRRDHRRMLAHAEIIVRTPHCHFAAATVAMKGSERELTRSPFQIGEDAVVAFAM
jgi:hypothetical protein